MNAGVITTAVSNTGDAPVLSGSTRAVVTAATAGTDSPTGGCVRRHTGVQAGSPVTTGAPAFIGGAGCTVAPVCVARPSTAVPTATTAVGGPTVRAEPADGIGITDPAASADSVPIQAFADMTVAASTTVNPDGSIYERDRT